MKGPQSQRANGKGTLTHTRVDLLLPQQLGLTAGGRGGGIQSAGIGIIMDKILNP